MSMLQDLRSFLATLGHGRTSFVRPEDPFHPAKAATSDIVEPASSDQRIPCIQQGQQETAPTNHVRTPSMLPTERSEAPLCC